MKASFISQYCIQGEKIMELTYQIGYDETISRWNVTAMGKEPFNSPKKSFEAEVNMEESYVQVVYPVREAFLKEERIQKAARYDGLYENLYFPFENNRIDLSTFFHTPQYICVHAKAGVRTAEEGSYPFDLYTCGGVRVWVNGGEQACYTPYTRNIAGHTRVNLFLKKGLNEIKVYADELAERDVFFYFELRYKGGTPVEGSVEVTEQPEEIKKAEEILKSCYFQQDMYTEGEVRLCYDRTLLDGDTRVYLTSSPCGTGMQLSDIEHSEMTLKKDEDYLVFAETEESSIRLSRISACLTVGNYVVPRNLFVGIIPKSRIVLEPAATIGERKQQALEFLVKNGEIGFQSVITSLELLKGWNDNAEKGFDLACKKIERHDDCADFSLAPLTLLMTRYRNLLTPEKAERIREMVLNFRYWIDEPGNDVMWYFSENHAFLFHVSQYLWGCIFGKETFTVSGRTGAEQSVIGKKRVLAWFDNFFAYGYAEWNSATYIPIDLIGFFSLYLNAPDEDIRQKAKRALDFTMQVIGFNSFEGVMNTTYGRIYEETIKTRLQVEPNFVSWVSTGRGYCTYYGNATCLYAVSDYEPEDYERECRPQPGQGVVMETDQGIAGVKINTYRTGEYLTAGVRRFKPFRHGHQQHLMNVVFGKERPAIFYVNHPGERVFSGENRPSYWAGNGTMPWIERYRNLTVMVFAIDPNELVHYIHAYTPVYEYEAYACDGSWFFAKSGDGYLGSWFSNGYEMTAYGANTEKELVSRGLNHAVIVKCGSKEEFGSFEAFQKSLKEMEIDWNGDRSAAFTDSQYGEIRVRDAEEFLVDGTAVSVEPAKGFRFLRTKL